MKIKKILKLKKHLDSSYQYRFLFLNPSSWSPSFLKEDCGAPGGWEGEEAHLAWWLEPGFSIVERCKWTFSNFRNYGVFTSCMVFLGALICILWDFKGFLWHMKPTHPCTQVFPVLSRVFCQDHQLKKDKRAAESSRFAGFSFTATCWEAQAVHNIKNAANPSNSLPHSDTPAVFPQFYGRLAKIEILKLRIAVACRSNYQKHIEPHYISSFSIEAWNWLCKKNLLRCAFFCEHGRLLCM